MKGISINLIGGLLGAFAIYKALHGRGKYFGNFDVIVLKLYSHKSANKSYINDKNGWSDNEKSRVSSFFMDL